jgi:ATP-dependent Clp protease adaptor protein ClpS
VHTNGFEAARVQVDDGRMTAPTIERSKAPEVLEADDPDKPWVTIVWNDPVNLMSYVTWVFQKLFGYSLDKATALMLDVHQKGKAAVSNGSREQMEHDVARLHAAGLWATLQQD